MRRPSKQHAREVETRENPAWAGEVARAKADQHREFLWAGLGVVTIFVVPCASILTVVLTAKLLAWL